MPRIATAALLAATAALLVPACGDDGGGAGGAGDRARIAELLEAEGESPESAQCFADQLSEFSADEFEAFLQASTPEEADGDLLQAAAQAAEVCSDG